SPSLWFCYAGHATTVREDCLTNWAASGPCPCVVQTVGKLQSGQFFAAISKQLTGHPFRHKPLGRSFQAHIQPSTHRCRGGDGGRPEVTEPNRDPAHSAGHPSRRRHSIGLLLKVRGKAKMLGCKLGVATSARRRT